MKDWEKFQRIEVKELLTLRGWRVYDERQLGPTKVDLYAEKEGEFGDLERIAVECKNYSDRLSKEALEKILLAYFPLIENKQIYRVLVVTRVGLSPAAEAYCRETRVVAHQTIHDLLDSVIDFGGYAQGMKAQFAIDHLDKLYVAQRYKTPSIRAADKLYVAQGHKKPPVHTDADLLSYVFQWINSSDSQPLAILAGYGMGKSSFARKLCHDLAERHFSDRRSRIPILLRLEEISAEQTLDGLLGKHFTSSTVVPRYSFPIFLLLNAMGRFVICLDGFDEMKKAMTWEALRFNLQQLNQLCAENAKVILLGRPTAFVNEEEQEEGLHGRIRVNGRVHRIPGWPDFQELYLEPFDVSELTEYFRKAIRVGKLNAEKNKRLLRALQALVSGSDARLVDLARRPVQAKMLIEILPDYHGSLDSMTTCILYDEFINLVIRRELDKPSRHSTFSMEQRRLFSQHIAAWMWSQGIGGQVVLSRVPDEVFHPFIPAGNEIDGLRRDLLSGSILEKKPPEGFYFPHRSFQEFLVAEYLVDLAEKLSPRFLEISFVTQEIQEFFLELFPPRGYKKLQRWLVANRGHVERQAAHLFVTLANRLGHSVPWEYADDLVSGEESFLPRDVIEAGHPEKRSSTSKSSAGKQKKSPHRQAGVTRKGKWW